MPFVMPFDPVLRDPNGETETIDMDRFYNVTEAVGALAPNRKLDVMLVQYFLKRIYENPCGPTPPKGVMKVDGACGPITRNWILKFQIDFNQEMEGAVLNMDSRVDRARGGNKGDLQSSRTSLFYTIHVLNRVFQFHYPEIHKNPGREMTIPTELRLAMVSPIPV